MMEEKLNRAAAELPAPDLDYSRVERQAALEQAKPRRRGIPIRRLAVALLAALLLVGCVAGQITYTLWNGGGTEYWKDAEKVTEKYGYTLPETLSGSPFLFCQNYNLTTQDRSWLLAILSPMYKYYEVSYGFERYEETVNPDGSTHGVHWVDGSISVTLGSLEDEIWRRQFGFNESDEWTGTSVEQERLQSLSSEVTEYGGKTLYLGTKVYNGSRGEHIYYKVTWIDQDHGIVLSVQSDDFSLEQVLETAKSLIDLNA